MAQQTLLGGDGTTGETGATHNSKANSNFTELYGATAAAQADADAATTAISDHISDGTDAHNASAISVVAFGSIGATDVQSALEEIAAEAGAVTVPDASTTVKGIAELLTQAEINTGTDSTRIVTAALLKALNWDVAVLTDASSIDITGPKHTLSSSSSTRTFTISYAGDFSIIELTLSATSATYTFPATALCVSDGFATGDNTCPLAGVSGDKYSISIAKIGSNYQVFCKNMGQ
jgi:hypothetical protein